MQKRTIRFMLITIVMGFMALTAIKAMAIDAPVMTAEPKYTAGATNTVAFTLPAEAVEVEVWQDGDNDPSNGGLQSWTSQDVPLPTQATFSGSADTLYYYYMRCKDSAGNWSGWSNIVSSMQHSGGPTFSYIEPGRDSWSNLADTPAISVTVSDPAGIDASSVTMTLDGVPVPAGYYPTSGRIAYTPAVKPTTGTHTVEVSVCDAAGAPAGPGLQGNRSTISWSFQVEVIRPQGPSTLTIPSPISTTAVTLQLSGASDAESGIGGYYVQFIFDRQANGSYYVIPWLAAVGGDGPVSITVPSYYLPTWDKTYEVFVWSVDKAGNVSNTSVTGTVTVDVVNPREPSQLSGPDGEYWNDTTPEFVWSGATDGNGIASYEVTLKNLKDNATRTYELDYAPDPFVWNVPESLPDGRYLLSIWSVDIVGHKSNWPKQRVITIDTAPPTTPTVEFPSVTRDSPNYWLPQFASTDDGSGIHHYHVEIWRDGTLVKSYSSDTQYLLPLDDVEGQYELRVRAVDAAGFVSTDYGKADFIYDHTAPVSPVVSVNNPDSFTPTFTISSSDSSSGLARYVIEWQNDDYYVDSSLETITWTVPADKPVEPWESQVLRVAVLDAAGNRTLDTLFWYEFPIRPDAPVVQGPSVTNNTHPTFQWVSAMDRDKVNPHPVTKYKVGLWLGQSCILTPVVIETTSWIVPDGVLSSDGKYQVRVWSIDDTGLESGSYGSVSFDLDRTPPANPASISGPQFTTSSSAEFAVLPVNAGSEAVQYRVERWQSGVCGWQITTTRTADTIRVQVPLAAGKNEIRAYSIDLAGNVSTTYASATATLDQETPQNVETITGPTATNDSHPVFSWSEVMDNGDSGLSDYYVELWAVGSSPALNTGTVPAVSGQISWTVPQDRVLVNGRYQFKVWAVDRAGNRSQTPAAHEFVLDITPPGLPSLSVRPFVNSRTPSFSWQPAVDDLTGVGAYSVELWCDNACVWGPARVAGTSVTLDDDAAISGDGQYELRVWSIDGVGNTSTTYASGSFLADTTAPDPPTTVEGSTLTNNRTPSFACSGALDGGSGVAGYYVEVFRYGALVRTFETSLAQWAIALTEDGYYEFRVWTNDRAGNRSSTCASKGFTLDSTAPLVVGPIEGPAATNSGQPTFRWPSAKDVLSGVDHFTVTIRLGQTVVQGPFTVPATNGLFTIWTIPAESALSQEGMYSISVECTDKAGNPSSNSMTFEFVLDKTSPESQPITLAPYTDSRTPYLSWSQTTPANVSYSVEIWHESQRILGPVRTESTGVKVSDTAALPEDGSYELRVWSVDLAGNVSSTYAAASFIVDTICPDPVLSIEGPSFTNNRNPSFVFSGARDEGSGVAGYKINVRDQSSQYYQWSSTSSTEWSVQGSLPRDGQYYVRVWAIDRAGNQSTTCATYSFVLDTVGPVMAGPVQGQSFTNNPQPTFTWSGASDTGSGVGGFEVTIKRDSTVVQNFKVPGSDGQAAWTIPAEGALTQEGAYTISVQCVDKAGNYSLDSLAFAFAFDTTSPAPPSLHYYPSCTNIRTPTFRWSQGTDNLTSVVRYSVQLWRDGACVRGPVEVNSPQVTLDDIVALSGEGQYELRVWSIDGAGNVSQTCASGSFLVDTTLPAPPVKVEGPAFAKHGDPSFTCSGGSDGGSGLGEYYIEVHKQTGEMVQSFWAGTEWTMSPMLAQDGQYEVRVWTQDRAGNRSETCVSCSFVLDSAAPAMVGPIEGQLVTSDMKPTFSWPAASDVGSGVDHYQVKLRLGTQELHGPYTVSASAGTVTWTLPSEYSLVESGVYTVEVWCADRAGNISSTISFQFTLDTTPPGLPQTLSVPYWTNSRTPSISWQPPNGGKVAGYSVEVWHDGALTWGPMRVTGESATVSVTEDGSYEIRVWSINEMGHASSTYAAAACNVDTVPPDPPSKVEGPAYTNTGTPTFFCSGPSIGYSGYQIEVHKQSGELVQSFHTTDLQWAIPTALTQEGQYELRVWAVDPAGNRSATYVSTTFVFDASAPSAPAVEGSAYTNDGTPSFTCSGTVDNGSGLDSYYIEVHKQFGELVQSFETAGSQWTIPTSLAQNGQYEVRVWANDKAGNRSATYASFSFLLDTVAPTMTGSLQGPAVTNNRRPMFSWPAGSDDTSGVDHYAVTITLGETVIHRLTVPVANGPVTWTIPQESALSKDGVYTITVECVDRAGNSSQSRTLTFRLVTVGPMVTILTPASGGTYTINESSSLWARANECASAQIRVDGGEWTDVTKVMADGSIFHFFATPLSPGVHTIELKVRDNAGNETVVSITITISGQRKGFGFGRFSFPGPGQ